MSNPRSAMEFLMLSVLGMSVAVAETKPLKVFILAGQSNMQGHATKSTIPYIADDPATKPLWQKMVDAEGNPRTLDEVFISAVSETGPWGRADTPVYRQGKLEIGYGGEATPANAEKFGPEYTFGIRMHEALREPILLIKTSWGGKSLHTDFRPPSAGPYPFSDAEVERIKKDPRKDLDAVIEDKKKATGKYYRMMMGHVEKVLRDMASVVPGYKQELGYELAGFVWFQGWNDMCDGSAYPDRDKPGGFDSYTKNLAHFIRDVRKELSAPKMPFVIGVMGVGGEGEQTNFRQAQAATAQLEEFKGNVVAVETGRFWDDALVAAVEKNHQLNNVRNTSYGLEPDGRLDRHKQPYPGWKPVGTPVPEARPWRYRSFDPQAPERVDKKEARRFKQVTLPDGLDGWFGVDFDDGGWDLGRAPIGTGEWKQGKMVVENASQWGGGEYLVMRSEFEIDELDGEEYRLSILARQGFDVYLNGHKIHTYIWWQNKPFYRSIMLSENETKYLKKGRNVLAAYACVAYDGKTQAPLASIDLFIESITAKDKARREKLLEQVCSLEERRIAAGSANAGYHYMGSGKILGQIGQAFADALLGLAGEK